MSSVPSPLQPTWRGHIASTMDALVLFEACLDGRLNHVPRRPHDREREDLIRSGNVFIYEEHSSGIKRWTDGYNWSPSRILGNFLIYRELEKPFPPGEKKKAQRKKHKNCGISKPEPSRPTPSVSVSSALRVSANDQQSETQRALIGSLIDSYDFKEDGLVKKTISVHWNGVPHHLVSYYKVQDVIDGTLHPPSRDPILARVVPRGGLISAQNFRVPVDQEEFSFNEDSNRWMQGGHYAADYPMMGGYQQRSMSVPNLQHMQMSYASQYAMPHMQAHGIATLPPNVSSHHYQSHGYGFDPVRGNDVEFCTHAFPCHVPGCRGNCAGY